MTDNRTEAEKISDLQKNIQQRKDRELTTEDEEARLRNLQAGQR
jgi:hypothetical protein